MFLNQYLQAHNQYGKDQIETGVDGSLSIKGTNFSNKHIIYFDFTKDTKMHSPKDKDNTGFNLNNSGGMNNSSTQKNNLSSLLNSNLVNLDNLQRTGPTNKWANPPGNSHNFDFSNSMSNNMNANNNNQNFYF